MTVQSNLKKLKRFNSIEQIILTLHKTLEPTKICLEEIPNLKINYIIENTLSNLEPVPVLGSFNITCIEIIGIINMIGTT